MMTTTATGWRIVARATIAIARLRPRAAINPHRRARDAGVNMVASAGLVMAATANTAATATAATAAIAAAAAAAARARTVAAVIACAPV